MDDVACTVRYSHGREYQMKTAMTVGFLDALFSSRSLRYVRFTLHIALGAPHHEVCTSFLCVTARCCHYAQR